MRRLPLIVFDLDDTLYLERDFARSGYRAAEAALADHYPASGFAATCLRLLDAGRRQCIFDEALMLHGIAPDPALVARLVRTYRLHRPGIGLAPDAARYLAGIEGRRPAALVTDGPARTQEAKIRALGLEAALGCIVCTGWLGEGMGKPHPRAFEIVEEWARPSGLPLVYVADNPAKDFVTPNARGWTTVEIRRAERVHRLPAPGPAFEARAAIRSMDELDGCLAEISLRAGTGFAYPPAGEQVGSSSRSVEGGAFRRLS